MTPARAGKKILVADDSLTIQKVIRLALSNEGYEIQAVSDGHEALQQIAVFRPDVVLIDVSLPGRSAFEVKTQVNRETDARRPRFILMSNAFESVDEGQAAEVIFEGRLTKPFDPAHLRQVLNQVLGGAAAAEPPTAREDFDLPPPPPSFASLRRPPPPPVPGPELPSARAVTPSLPLMPPPPPEPKPTSDDLWSEGSPDAGPALSTDDSDPFADFGTEPSLGSIQNTSHDDIRNLTESTIRLSGLDGMNDFQWSVNDQSKRLQSGAPAFQFTPDPAPVDDEPGSSSEPTLAPPRGLRELSGATFRLDETESEAAIPTHSPPAWEPAVSQDSPAESPASGATAAPFDAEAIEAMVERQVRVALEKMAQRILPEVAERVIKQEIHRLLEESP